MTKEQFSNESTASWEAKTANQGTHIAQACAELGIRILFHKDPDPAVRHSILEQALDWPLCVFKSCTASMMTLNHREILPQLDLTTMIFQGRHNNNRRYNSGRFLAKNIPGAGLLTFGESAHTPQIEEMELFDRMLDRLINTPPVVD